MPNQENCLSLEVAKSPSYDHRKCCLLIERIEGISGSFFCKASLPNSSRYRTSVSKKGLWNQSFTIELDCVIEDILFEICEQGWLGERVVGSYVMHLEPGIDRIMRTAHLSIRGAPVSLHVGISFTKEEMPSPQLTGRKRSCDELDMVGYFQSKVKTHKAMIDSLDLLDGADLVGDDKWANEIVHILQLLEQSIVQFQQSGEYYSSDELISKEQDYLDTLSDLPSLLRRLVSASDRLEAVANKEESGASESVREALRRIQQTPISDVTELEAKMKELQQELVLEKNKVQALQKKNSELEAEVQIKTVELSYIKEKEAKRDKAVLDSLQIFDEKFKVIEKERQILGECERKLHARELELEKREVEIDTKLQAIRSKKTTKNSGKDTDAGLYVSGAGDLSQSSSLDVKLSNISSQLAKLDHFNDIMNRIQQTIAAGGVVASEAKGSKRSAAEIKEEMQKLQEVILNESADQKDREAANIKIDRLFVELASTDEYKQELRRAQEEKARINEPLNKEALKNIQEKGIDEARKRQSPALTLIDMERDQILGKHQNDFNQYLLGDLTLEEVRAIRASLPAFRRDQKRQQEFVEAVDLKIEQLAKSGASAATPKPKKVFPRVVSAISKAAAGGGLSLGNLAAELAKRRKSDD